MPEGDPRGRGVGPKSLIVAAWGPLLWVVDMEGDVASDLSVFHRVDDVQAMGSRRWAQLVSRLAAYPGVVQFRLKAEAMREQAAAEESDGAVVQAPRPVAAVAPVVAPQAPSAAPDSPGAAGAPRVLLPGPPSPMTGGKVVGSSAAELRFSDIGDMFSFG